MAKKALIEREKKRQHLVKKFESKRLALKSIIGNLSIDENERYQAALDLQQLPRNANPTRVRLRCALTGRPRGNFRRFGLGRTKIRELAMSGEIPGIIKASW